MRTAVLALLEQSEALGLCFEDGQMLEQGLGQGKITMLGLKPPRGPLQPQPEHRSREAAAGHVVAARVPVCIRCEFCRRVDCGLGFRPAGLLIDCQDSLNLQAGQQKEECPAKLLLNRHS